MQPMANPMLIKRFRELHWFLKEQVGIDLKMLATFVTSIWGFSIRYIVMSMNTKHNLVFMPALHDKKRSSGEYSDEYFTQDLYVAQRIYCNNPANHLDIGSRVNGFVNSVASFRKIDVVDIRVTEATRISSNILLSHMDLCKSREGQGNKQMYESISCLHALEHFGLGRYGDSIDFDAYTTALQNIWTMLLEDGIFYLCVPTGRPRICFNAHRIFDYDSLSSLLEKIGFTIREVKAIRPSTRHGVGCNIIVDYCDEFSKSEGYCLTLFVLNK